MKIFDQIKQTILNAVPAEYISTANIRPEDIGISYPENIEHGHVATNIAMRLAKAAGVNPQVLAQQIKEKLSNSDFISNVEVAGPGFINIFLSEQALKLILQELVSNQNNLARSNVGNGQHYIVEYSSPNIAKPFTIGHLRSTIIGDAVANLLESQGYTVYRDNHLGDWGSQFGKLTYAVQKWGNIEDLEKSENVISDLVNLYVKYHEVEESDPEVKQGGRDNFRKLEQGDPEIRELWQKCIDWSFAYFAKIYARLQVKPFTENSGRGYGESFFEDKMAAVIEELKQKLPQNFKENDGAWLVFFEKETKLPPLMILKSDGSTLYATRDLATDKFRLQNYPAGTKIVNEIGAEQSLYMRQVFKTEQMLGWYKEGERVHVKHGLYRLPEGKMSTRKGTVIWVEDVLNEAVTRAKQIAQENEIAGDADQVAEAVGIGAVKFNDLKRTPELDIVFNWDEVLALKGFSGPYIQYMYARCKSILRKAAEQGIQENLNESAITETLEQQLLLTLGRFNETVTKAAHQYAPSLVCTYLYELAQLFSKFYTELPVLNATSAETKTTRLALTSLTAKTIGQGLELLGIATLEQM